MDVKVDENSSRSEKILGKLTGEYSGNLEEPQSRIEALLFKLSDAGSSAEPVDLSEYVKKSDLSAVTKQTETAAKQEEELAADYPEFKLVSSIDEMSDHKTIYLMKDSDGKYGVYIWTQNYKTNAVEFTRYGTVSHDLSEYKPIDAMVSFIWSFSDPRSD